MVDDALARGQFELYGQLDEMNTISYLNLVAFKIAQNKEEKRQQEIQSLKLKYRR